MDGRTRGDDAYRSLEHAAWSWLESDSFARLMVDRSLRLLWSNRSADVILAGRQELTLRNGVLATADPARQDALRATILAAAPALASLCLARPDGEGWLVVDAVRIAPSPADIFGLALTVVQERERARYRHLDDAFFLTTTEHRVLLGLLDGNEAEVLAARSQVSIDTIRTHIRSIYAKLGVKSREQMFARLHGFQS